MPQKVLIVDDDQPTRTGLAMLLEDAGYEAITASSVPSAIKLLTDEHPDLLIVDIRLEEYNGLHLVAMRRDPIPAVVLTGFADPAIEADARHLGAEFLLKPIAPAALTALVKRLLSGDGRQGWSMPRRWTRKPVTRDVLVNGDGAAARMLDISYGGVCIEMHRSADAGPPGMFTMIVPPAELPVPVEVVWSRRRDATTWLCGGVVREDQFVNWRTLVDSMA